MEPQISFSGRISKLARQHCAERLWRTCIEIVPLTSKVLCHISDRTYEYSGILFIHLATGERLAAHSIAEDPIDVLDELTLNIESQIKYYLQSVFQVPSQDNSKVMIVDDDPDSVELIQNVLTKLKQPSIFIQDPHEAIEMMVQDKYKLVVMDLLMPELNGLEVIAHADEKLDLRPDLMKKRKRFFTTFSGEEKCDISPAAFDQFKYLGHWKKQQNYSQLMMTVSKTLFEIGTRHAP